MARARRFAGKWWQAGVAIAAMLTALGAMAVAYPTLKQTQDFATAGQLARERQCRILPVSDKLFKGAAHYGIITRQDLRVYESVVPHCPAP